MVGRFAHPRDLLEELVRDVRTDSPFLVTDRSDVFHLVDEDDGLRQLEQPVEGVGEQLRLPIRSFRSDLRRLNLDERPAKPRGDPLGKRCLPRPWWAEEDDRLRLLDGVARSELRLGERQDHASLDDLLRFVHAPHVVPQAGRDDARPDRIQGDGAADVRDLAVEHRGACWPEATLRERVAVARDRCDHPRACRCERPGQRIGQFVRGVAVHGVDAIDPADATGDRPQATADDALVVLRDEADRGRVQQQAHRGVGAGPHVARGFPETQDLSEIVGGVWANDAAHFLSMPVADSVSVQ